MRKWGVWVRLQPMHCCVLPFMTKCVHCTVKPCFASFSVTSSDACLHYLDTKIRKKKNCAKLFGQLSKVYHINGKEYRWLQIINWSSRLSRNCEIAAKKPNFANSWNPTPWHSTFARLNVLMYSTQRNFKSFKTFWHLILAQCECLKVSTFGRLKLLSRQLQQDAFSPLFLCCSPPPPPPSPPPGLPGGAGEENSTMASPLLGHTWWLLQVLIWFSNISLGHEHNYMSAHLLEYTWWLLQVSHQIYLGWIFYS